MDCKDGILYFNTKDYTEIVLKSSKTLSKSAQGITTVVVNPLYIKKIEHCPRCNERYRIFMYNTIGKEMFDVIELTTESQREAEREIRGINAIIDEHKDKLLWMVIWQ